MYWFVYLRKENKGRKIVCMMKEDKKEGNTDGSNERIDESHILCKGKAVPLQAWTGPEGSRKLRFPDFMTTAQDGGKVVSLTHRPPLPPGNNLVLIYVRG